MTVDDLRKRLLYRSTHRGMKEMDALLGGYAKIHLSSIADTDLESFESLLDESDNDLMNWILEREPLPQTGIAGMLSRIIDYKKTL